MITGARALQNASDGLARTAENIARSPLEASREQSRQQQRSDTEPVAGAPPSQPPAATRAASNLARDPARDPARDLVDLGVYQRQTETAAVVIQRSDAAVGSLLDTFA